MSSLAVWSLFLPYELPRSYTEQVLFCGRQFRSHGESERHPLFTDLFFSNVNRSYFLIEVGIMGIWLHILVR